MKARKILFYLVAVIVAVNMVLFGLMFLTPTHKRPPTPNPNGYDDFSRAGEALKGRIVATTNQTRDDLAKIIFINSQALQLVHLGVTRECLTPDDYKKLSDRMSTDLPAFKSLAALLCMEAKVGELDGRTNDAAKIYLDAVRFADASSRGGLLINKLLSVACEAMAMHPLQDLKPSLDAAQCAEIARALEDVDAKSDSFETIMENEATYSKAVGGLRGQLAQMVMYKSQRAAKQKALEKIQAGVRRRRQAIVAFAARAYELDNKGKAPASAADLVPAYLKSVPKDPANTDDITDVPGLH